METMRHTSLEATFVESSAHLASREQQVPVRAMARLLAGSARRASTVVSNRNHESNSSGKTHSTCNRITI